MCFTRSTSFAVTASKKTASKTLHTVTVAPIPSASERTDTAVKTGLLYSPHPPYRRSCQKRSSHIHPHISRTSSLTRVRFPNSRFAAKRASSLERPAACCSSSSRSRWSRSSRSRSSSRLLRLHQDMSALLDGPHHASDRGGHLLPSRFLCQQLFSTALCQP